MQWWNEICPNECCRSERQGRGRGRGRGEDEGRADRCAARGTPHDTQDAGSRTQDAGAGRTRSGFPPFGTRFKTFRRETYPRPAPPVTFASYLRMLHRCLLKRDIISEHHSKLSQHRHSWKGLSRQLSRNSLQNPAWRSQWRSARSGRTT